MHTPMLSGANGAVLGPGAVQALDLCACAAYFLRETRPEEVQAFFVRYLSRDPAEIGARAARILALAGTPDMPERLEAVRERAGRMRFFLGELDRRPGPLGVCNCFYRLLTLYVESVDGFCAALEEAGDPALAELRRTAREFRDGGAYARARDCLGAARAHFTPLTDAAVGVNLSEGGDALQVCVTELNAGGGAGAGLLGKPQEPPENLLSAAPLRSLGMLAHLEAFVLFRAEREWRGDLAKTLGILRGFPPDVLRDWLAWLEPLDFYIAGLRCARALAARGCPLCAPRPAPAGIAARELYYPHMALAGEGRLPVPCDAGLPGGALTRGALTRGALTLITGANHSGKTSFLKAVAQACVLAQLGFPVPARDFAFAPFGEYLHLFSAGEDGSMALSRFQQEARAAQALVRQAGPDSLVLFNEPFTGTNPAEAAPILRDLLLRLLERGATALLVTHLYEVYGLLREAGCGALHSLVTVSEAAPEGLRHAYRLEARPPDGESFARLVAAQFGLTPGALLPDPVAARAVEAYLAGGGRA